MNNKNKQFSRGLGLVEGVVAVAIVGTVFVAMIGAFNLFLRTALATSPELKAVFLVEEGLESVRAIRDIDWDTEIDSLTIDTPYYLSFSDGRWQLSTTQSYVDGTHERIVTFEAVNRDVDGRIVTSGGTLDPDTKKVIVSVSVRSVSNQLLPYCFWVITVTESVMVLFSGNTATGTILI